MRAGKYDPAVWVVIALLGVALLSVLMVFATRGCVLALQESFGSVAAEIGSYEQIHWEHTAVELEADDYAALMEKAESIDFGIGVHLGSDMERVEAMLGEADTVARVSGGAYEHTYIFSGEAAGPSPQQRHRGSFFAQINLATLTLTAADEKVTGVAFYASPASNGDEVNWPFLTLNGKPLVQCTKDDLAAILGEPTESTRYNVTWRFVPAGVTEETPMPAETDSTSPGGVAEGQPPAESSAADAGDTPDTGESAAPASAASAPGLPRGIEVEAMLDTGTGFLYSLELRER
jgi:hypothetical protein